jgi:type IV secretory pathway VirB10-like protein
MELTPSKKDGSFVLGTHNMALRALLIAIALLIAGAVGLATYHYVGSESKPEPAAQVSIPLEIGTPPVDAAVPSAQPTAAPVAEAPPATPPTAESDAKPVAAKGSPAKPSAKKAKPKSKPAE